MLKKSEQEKYGLVRAIIRQLENKASDIEQPNWEPLRLV